MQQVGCSVVPGWPAQHICMSGVYSPIYSSSKWQWGSVYSWVRPLSSQPIFIMALWTGSDDWQELLTKIGIPADSARTYAKTFVEESITKDDRLGSPQRTRCHNHGTCPSHPYSSKESSHVRRWVIWLLHLPRIEGVHWTMSLMS